MLWFFCAPLVRRPLPLLFILDVTDCDVVDFVVFNLPTSLPLAEVIIAGGGSAEIAAGGGASVLASIM